MLLILPLMDLLEMSLDAYSCKDVNLEELMKRLLYAYDLAILDIGVKTP